MRYRRWAESRTANDVEFLVLAAEEKLSARSDRVIEFGFDLAESWLRCNLLIRGFQRRFQFEPRVAVDSRRVRLFEAVR